MQCRVQYNYHHLFLANFYFLRAEIIFSLFQLWSMMVDGKCSRRQSGWSLVDVAELGIVTS